MSVLDVAWPGLDWFHRWKRITGELSLLLPCDHTMNGLLLGTMLISELSFIINH